MKRGLVIGKFLPVHFGHLALIDFAAARCDELIVSMSYTPDDPIEPIERFRWLRDACKDKTKVKPQLVLDDFDDETLPTEARVKLWASYVKDRFPAIDVLFSSEHYGDLFAKELGIPHVEFDKARVKVPVSASRIRQDPFGNWDYIPPVVRPYFVKKVCFYGPESTGKTVLAKKLAAELHTAYVPEVAREIVSSNAFSAEDIIRIGHAQTMRVFEKAETANKILLCDTDVITTQIYSNKYLREVPKVLFELEKKVHYDLYLLFNVDTPWVADGLRDLPDQREEMFLIFRNELVKRNLAFVEVHGDFPERERIVRRELARLLQVKNPDP